MKKIPTLFTRVFDGRRIIDIKNEITPGCEEAFKHGIATIKFDGSCCAVIDGKFTRDMMLSLDVNLRSTQSLAVIPIP